MPRHPQEPERILLIRLSAIGDIVMATAVLPALRRRYPAARIDWLTQGPGLELLRDHPLLDGVVELPRKHWRGLRKARAYGRLAASMGSFVRALRAERYDWTIDLQGLWKSAVWARASGAGRRLSLRPAEGSGLLAHERVSDGDPEGTRPICREYRALLRHLGLDPSAAAMVLGVSGASRERARALLGAQAGAPIYLFPFTTRPQKHWFDSRWSQLAAELHRTAQRPVWILGGPGDEARAQDIARASRSAGVHVRAGTASDLEEKKALLALGGLAIGVDTGLTHMSFALGLPTIALFGSTCPYRNVAPHTGRVFYAALDCAPCRRHPTCDGRFDCMRAHAVEQVRDAALALLPAAQTTPHADTRPAH